MEQAALNRGCESAMIETLHESACALYIRAGYEVITCIPGYVGPFNRYILLKQLAQSAARI